MDYAKYFAYAGLRLEVTSKEAPGAYLDINTHSQDGKFFITSVTPGSPAEAAGLRAQDQLLEVDGAKAAPKSINDLLAAKKSGDRIGIHFLRDNAPQDLELILAANFQRAFDFHPVENPGALASAILKDWMRQAQSF